MQTIVNCFPVHPPPFSEILDPPVPKGPAPYKIIFSLAVVTLEAGCNEHGYNEILAIAKSFPGVSFN